MLLGAAGMRRVRSRFSLERGIDRLAGRFGVEAGARADMRIAFYAPMKPPDDPRPSGDRTMARLLMAALREAGPRRSKRPVDCPASMRVGDRRAPAAARRGRRNAGRTAGASLAATAGGGTGPISGSPIISITRRRTGSARASATALGIPYVVAEASHAGKQARGPLGAGSRGGGRRRSRRADLILGLNADDSDGIRPLLADPARLLAAAAVHRCPAVTRRRATRDRHRRCLVAAPTEHRIRPTNPFC